MVSYDLRTGFPVNVITPLKRSIAQHMRYNEYVKVGITGRNPEKRFNEHRRSEPDWREMIVLYETNSCNFANRLENELISYFRKELYNFREGGGSSLCSKGSNYLYIMLA